MVLNRVASRLNIIITSPIYLLVDLHIITMPVDAKTAAENNTVQTTRVDMMATTAELSAPLSLRGRVVTDRS